MLDSDAALTCVSDSDDGVGTCWRDVHPDRWTSEHVKHWIYQPEHFEHVDVNTLRGERFLGVDGAQLRGMRREDWEALDRDNGAFLHERFQALISSESLWRVRGEAEASPPLSLLMPPHAIRGFGQQFVPLGDSGESGSAEVPVQTQILQYLQSLKPLCTCGAKFGCKGVVLEPERTWVPGRHPTINNDNQLHVFCHFLSISSAVFKRLGNNL